ncbi:MAG: hypothetical protein ACO3F2_05760 [Roseiflexaceae bacterium]
MQIRHIPPIIIMMISGMIGIRLALSPVAVTSTTCTEDHPYYLSNCDEPDWTATPVTVYPTASENDMPDTDPPIQIPTQNATQIAELTTTAVPTTQLLSTQLTVPQSANTPSFDTTPTSTPTATRMSIATRTRTRVSTPIMAEQVVDDDDTTLLCQRQMRLIIRGTTDPYSLLLLTFADRVVGGGISYASGGYAIPLVVGDEASGIYQIEVRQRNTNQVITQLLCTVP